MDKYYCDLCGYTHSTIVEVWLHGNGCKSYDMIAIEHCRDIIHDD